MSDKKRIEELERALRIIHTWAIVFHDQYLDQTPAAHIRNYENIVAKCNEALKK